MDSKSVIFKNGHFYEPKTGNRIKVVDGANICVVGNDEDFYTPEPVGKKLNPIKSSEEQLRSIMEDEKIKKYRKILDRSSVLFFNINRSSEEITVNHQFKVLLLEDLYVHLKHTQKDLEGKLLDCACVVIENTNASIEYFENIYGKSLNEIYKNTYVHFLGNEGNPACNALDRFYQDCRQPEQTLINRYRKFEEEVRTIFI